jgi:acetylglutamate kinase
VAGINCAGGRAVGISGIDGSLLRGRIKNQELGYVGVVEKVDPAPLEALLQAGFVPVVSPLCLYAYDRPPGAPQMLNVNGDPLAGEIAAAVGAEKLVFITNVEGVCDQSGQRLPRLSADEAREMVTSGVASGGMIPKIDACLKALSAAATTCIIDGRREHALLREVEGDGGGTVIYK